MQKGALERFICPAQIALCLTASALLISPIGRTQATNATFYGIVKDPSGAAIPGAQVTLVQLETRATSAKTTDSQGEFVFNFLSIGSYLLKIEAKGFKNYERTGIHLVGSQQVRQTFELEVGTVSQTVKVEGAAPLVNTVSAEQLQTFESQAVQELPLSRRNVGGILRVGTGVSSSGDSVRLNGVGKHASVFTVDGTQTSGNPEGRQPSSYQRVNYIDLMSIEAIQEVHTVKGVLPAEFGDTLGGHVNLVTRSGTNSWHGSLFENYEGAALSARFQAPRVEANNVHKIRRSLAASFAKDRLLAFICAFGRFNCITRLGWASSFANFKRFHCRQRS